MQEERAKLRKVHAEPITPSSLPMLPKEEMVPNKHMRNLVELPLRSAHTLVAIGYIEHYGQQKLVVKLENGILCQAGDNLEEQKEQLLDRCSIIITKIRVNNSTKRKFAVLKSYNAGIGLAYWTMKKYRCCLRTRYVKQSKSWTLSLWSIKDRNANLYSQKTEQCTKSNDPSWKIQ